MLQLRLKILWSKDQILDTTMPTVAHQQAYPEIDESKTKQSLCSYWLICSVSSISWPSTYAPTLVMLLTTPWHCNLHCHHDLSTVSGRTTYVPDIVFLGIFSLSET